MCQTTLHLAGEYETGKSNDQARAEMSAKMSEMRQQIEEIETTLSAQAQKDQIASRAPFEVTLWQTPDSPEPVATVPILAKMPLGALVFAMHKVRATRAGYAVVRFTHGQTEYYHVRMGRTQLHYERLVEVVGTEAGKQEGEL